MRPDLTKASLGSKASDLVVFVMAFIYLIFIEQLRGGGGLNGDEIYSLSLAQSKSFLELMARSRADNSPPLYCFVLWLWMSVSGVETELGIRLPSLFAGALAVFILWKTGPLLGISHRYRLLLPCLALTNTVYLEACFRARAYVFMSLMLAGGMFCLVALPKALNESKSHALRYGLTFVLLSSGLTYLHVVGYLFSFVLNLWIGLIFLRRKRLATLLSLYAVQFVICLPSLHHILHSASRVSASTTWSLKPPSMGTLLLSFVCWSDVGLMTFAFQLFLLAVGLAYHPRTRNLILLLAFLQIAPLALAAAISYLLLPIWGFYYLIPGVVPWAASLAIGLQCTGTLLSARFHNQTLARTVTTIWTAGVFLVFARSSLYQAAWSWPLPETDWGRRSGDFINKTSATQKPQMFVFFPWEEARLTYYIHEKLRSDIHVIGSYDKEKWLASCSLAPESITLWPAEHWNDYTVLRQNQLRDFSASVLEFGSMRLVRLKQVESPKTRERVF